MKTCIITFQIPKSDPLLRELNALFGRSNHVVLMVAANEMDILKAMKAHGNALLITNIASKAHLQRSVGLFKTNAKLIKASLLRPVAILHTENKKIDRILTKYGCKDVMEPGLSGKTLKYKIDFWIKTIQRNMAKIEALKKQKMASSKQLESESETNSKKDYIETKQLDLASDMWIIDADNDIKKILRRYLIKVKGPSPYAVRWVEMKRNPRDKFPTWKAVIEGDDAELLVMDEGAWFFVGPKPDFDWNANIWNFSSEEPHLFFYTQDKKVFSRFRLAKGGLYVAKNSDAAKQKVEVIENTFEKDIKKLEKLQRMQEAEQAGQSDEFGHLDETGNTDRMNPHEEDFDSSADLDNNEQLDINPDNLLSLEQDSQVDAGEELNPNEQLPNMDMGDLLGSETEEGEELSSNEQLPEMDMGDLLSDGAMGEEASGPVDADMPGGGFDNLLDEENMQEPGENFHPENMMEEHGARPRAGVDDDLYGEDGKKINPHGYEEFDEGSVARVEGGEYEGHYEDPSGNGGGSPFDGATQRSERNGMDLEGKFNNKADVLEDEVLSREKTDHITHEDLEGNADTEHLDHDPMSGRSSTDQLDHDPMSGRSSTDQIDHDPMSGRASTDAIDGDPMSGRGFTDEIDADPLSGRSYTDEIDGDPLSGRSSTDEYGEDPLEGRGETEEFDGHMEGRGETDEIDSDPLSGPASNEEIGNEPLSGELETEHIESDPLSGSSYDSEEGSGPMEGAVGETDHIQSDPLSGSAHDSSEEHEYEEYEDEDGQVHRRKKKSVATYEHDDEASSGNKSNHYEEMDFDPDSEADGEGKDKAKYDWDESLFEEERKKKDKEGAQYYRDEDEAAQSRQSEIEEALGGINEEVSAPDFNTESGTSGSGPKLDIDLDAFLDEDPGVNTESGKVMVIVNQTTKEGNELSIIAEFADYFEDEVTVNVPRDSLVNDAPVEIDLKMKYGKTKKRIKIKGEVLELENYDEEKDQLIVKAPNLNVEEMDKFMEMFAERQENIQDFMQKARGY
ncbi:hypothetical protein N9N67_08455 [Bacteriovoracaceae bacterium]|nr:hypothetical protein [Bacteriovoracaceae bacterium]